MKTVRIRMQIHVWSSLPSLLYAPIPKLQVAVLASTDCYKNQVNVYEAQARQCSSTVLYVGMKCSSTVLYVAMKCSSTVLYVGMKCSSTVLYVAMKCSSTVLYVGMNIILTIKTGGHPLEDVNGRHIIGHYNFKSLL